MGGWSESGDEVEVMVGDCAGGRKEMRRGFDRWGRCVGFRVGDQGWGRWVRGCEGSRCWRVLIGAAEGKTAGVASES